jgi:hypothetical protein
LSCLLLYTWSDGRLTAADIPKEDERVDGGKRQQQQQEEEGKKYAQTLFCFVDLPLQSYAQIRPSSECTELKKNRIMIKDIQFQP